MIELNYDHIDCTYNYTLSELASIEINNGIEPYLLEHQSRLAEKLSEVLYNQG